MVESRLDLRLVWLQNLFPSPPYHALVLLSSFYTWQFIGEGYSATSILAKVSDIETEF